MISVSQAVLQIVKASPLIEEGLHRDIISYSALARDIQDEVEDKVFKDVTVGSIIMALKRIHNDIQHTGTLSIKQPKLEHMTVRSNLVEITLLNSPSIADKYSKLFTIVEKRKDLFCSVSQGVKEITLILSESLETEVGELFRGEVTIARLHKLSAITLSLPKYIVTTPGAYYTILKKLAWERINVVEVLSTYTEFTIVVATADLDSAFSVLRNE